MPSSANANGATPSAATDEQRRPPQQQQQQQPHAFQGGWQGVNVDFSHANKESKAERSNDERQQEQQQQEQESQSATTTAAATTRTPTWLLRWERNYPRTFHVFSFIIVPLLILIVVAFVCGYFVALLESENERLSNNEALADVVQDFALLGRLAEAAQLAPTLCLEAYEPSDASASFNRTELEEHMQSCGAQLATEIDSIVESFTGKWLEQIYDRLSFDWTICRNDSQASRQIPAQVEILGAAWLDSFAALEAATNDTDYALANAVGTQDCETNAAAGALFWFTVMTTIGYGNATPTTPGGRILVYTFGFLSILLFSAIIGHAGYVALVVADDALKRVRWHRLTQGYTAVLLWMIVYLLWVLVIAGVALVWTKNRMGDDVGFDFGDALWFSYISVTTVGFGDFFIWPFSFRAFDMLYIPLIFLIGFVLLANFLLKLSEVVMTWGKAQSRPSLERVLAATREQQPAGGEERNGIDTKTKKEELGGGDGDGDGAAEEEW